MNPVPAGTAGLAGRAAVRENATEKRENTTEKREAVAKALLLF